MAGGKKITFEKQNTNKKAGVRKDYQQTQLQLFKCH